LPQQTVCRSTDAAQARSAGRQLLLICGVLGAMVLVIVVARVLRGGTIAPLSLALPIAGLAWLASIGIRVLRSAPRANEAAATPSERPSRRVPRFDGDVSSSRADRPSDAGRHVNA
jgi:threonine/homoserine/homoserine lactone efflux protein